MNLMNVSPPPHHGFKNAQDYYAQCSALPKLNQIKLPTQIIHAKDDPSLTSTMWFQKSSSYRCCNIDYRLFQKGGHVGFILQEYAAKVLPEEAAQLVSQSIQDSA